MGACLELVLGVAVWCGMAVVTAILAGKRGRDSMLWFLYGAAVWPVALVHLIVLPDETKVVAESGLKLCPDCSEKVPPEARICRFCGHRFLEAE
jgi:hypothetical protein